MKKAIKWLKIPVIAALLFYGLAPKYEYRYYYSRDRSRVLTRVTFPNAFLFLNDTYLTPGEYSKHKKPEVYIMPTPNSHGEWAEYVTFHSNGIFITGTQAETKNLSPEFRFMVGTSADYSYMRKIDSIKKSLADTTRIALYTFDK